MDELEKFYNRTLRFLSYRPRSEKEIKNFLKRKKVDELLASKVLKKLRELNLVNDEEFAKFWVEQRTIFRPKGLRLIKLELRQKGIDEETIEMIVESGKLRVESEKELASRVLQKKLNAWSKLPEEKFREKAVAFLLRRGFDFETIKKVIDENWKKGYNAK